MKIKNILQLSVVAITLCFVVIGFVENRHIAHVANAFRSLQAHRAPSLTALLELMAATRRASIKSMEYSIRGKPGDRTKTIEALEQIDREWNRFQSLGAAGAIAVDPDLTRKKEHFVRKVEEYLQISEGPVIDKVLTEQAVLHQARKALIGTVDDAMPQDLTPAKLDLLTIKSEARRISVKAVEYILLGNPADQEEALGAIEELRRAGFRYVANNPAAAQSAQAVTDNMAAYLSTAEGFLRLMPAGSSPVADIYAFEQEVHAARTQLVRALYPLIERQYEELGNAATTTSDRIVDAGRLHIYSIGAVALVAILAGIFFARWISTPVSQLSGVVSRFGRGEPVSPQDIPARGARELERLGQAITDMIREREELEHAVKERESYVRMLFDTSPVGLALARMDGTLVDVNPAYAAITGRSVEQILGLTYWQITPEDYAGQEAAQLEALQQDGRYGPYEKEYWHKDGHRVPVRLTGRLVERDGESFIWSAVEDISASHEVVALSNRLRNILEHSFDEIYIFDGNTLNFVQVSSGAQANLGYSIDELRGMTAVDLKPDFTHASFSALIEPLRRGDLRQLVFETRHRRKDGSHYPVEVRLQFSGEQGPPTFFAIILDLTERKRIEAELELHRQHLEELVKERTATVRRQAQIIDQSHDSIITTDLEGQITSWNDGAQKLFGHTAEDAVGRHVAFLYPENQREFLENGVIAPLRERGNHETEVRMLRADGSEFPAHLSLSLLRNDDGSPRGWVGYSIDISELKQREAELKQLASRLRASNDELETFAYSVSHDLRAPLRAIDGFSLALAEDSGDRLDTTGLDYLQRVRGAAQRMGELIDDLLQLSRVNRGELKLAQVDLAEVAQSVFEELKATEPDRKVELTLGKQMLVHGDARLLRIVLDNLLGNAWKFSGREPVSRITFDRLAKHPGTFYIQDNGVGFDIRYADKLFGAFQRLHRATDFPGTGVGLATAQRVIHRHGGRIWATAEENVGATFFFQLDPSVELPNTTKIQGGG